MSVTILIPVLRRPQKIQPLVRSIEDSTPRGSFDILFIASPNDNEEINELKSRSQPFIVMDDNYENRGDYARKINRGFASIESEWYFLGADDLSFHPGWFTDAIETHRKSKACAIGTNDMGNPLVMRGQHATHSLVLGEYVQECGTMDEPGKILHEGYRHNFCDSEFVETAKCRGAWAFSRTSKVEHLHPDWKKGSKDPVYDIGVSGWDVDRRHFEGRKRLWA